MAGRMKILTFPGNIRNLERDKIRLLRIFGHAQFDKLQERMLRIQYLQTHITYLRTIFEMRIAEKTRELEFEWQHLHREIKNGAKTAKGPLKAFFKYRIQFEHSRTEIHKLREHSELIVK